MKEDKIIHTVGFKITAMVIFIAVTVFLLSQYALLVGHLITIAYNWQFELFMVMGMFFFQYPFIFKRKRSLKLNYYFNMLFVSFVGALLLIPLLLLNHYSACSDTFHISYFFAVVIMMFFDHKRRVAKLGLPVLISYTWVLYRFIILIFILN